MRHGRLRLLRFGDTLLSSEQNICEGLREGRTCLSFRQWRRTSDALLLFRMIEEKVTFLSKQQHVKYRASMTQRFHVP